LKNFISVNPSFSVVCLRYFNIVGTHPDGVIGDTEPLTLLTNLNDVASGRQRRLSIFGSQYSTSDGTPMRDYTDISDITKANIKALKA
jgi:UDP-glucose 4-epimerase